MAKGSRIHTHRLCVRTGPLCRARFHSDIYGFSAELPVRVDFFGDEIDSIRSFNVETQLSEHSHSRVEITANVRASGDNISLPQILPADTLVAVRDARTCWPL